MRRHILSLMVDENPEGATAKHEILLEKDGSNQILAQGLCALIHENIQIRQIVIEAVFNAIGESPLDIVDYKFVSKDRKYDNDKS